MPWNTERSIKFGYTIVDIIEIKVDGRYRGDEGARIMAIATDQSAMEYR